MRILDDLGDYLRHGVSDQFQSLPLRSRLVRMIPWAKQMTPSGFASCWAVVAFARLITQVYFQDVAFGDNSYARNLTSLSLNVADVSHVFPMIRNCALQINDGIPGNGETTCQVISTGRSFRHQPVSADFNQSLYNIISPFHLVMVRRLSAGSALHPCSIFTICRYPNLSKTVSSI